MSDVYKVGAFVPMSQQMADEIGSLTGMFDRALNDAMWSWDEQLRNGHLGPRHRPGRNELYEVRRRAMWVASIRTLGRPAGRYQRSERAA